MMGGENQIRLGGAPPYNKSGKRLFLNRAGDRYFLFSFRFFIKGEKKVFSVCLDVGGGAKLSGLIQQ